MGNVYCATRQVLVCPCVQMMPVVRVGPTHHPGAAVTLTVTRVPQRTVVVGVIVPSPPSITVVTVHRRCRVNLAHTVFAAFMVTVQVAPLALSQPPHDLNSYSSDCVREPVAVMVTTVPAVKLATQLTATVPPPVVQATLPPVPAVAFSEYVVGGGGGGGGRRTKLAVTSTRVWLAVVGTTQVLALRQLALDQPVKR